MAASRLNRKDKQRKVNKFYNISIALVSLLIVIVAVTIFFGNNEESKTETAASNSGPAKQTPAQQATTEQGTSASGSDEQQADAEQNTDELDSGDEEAADEELAEEEQEDKEKEKKEQKKKEPKVGEPVGTTQTGEHVTSFEKGSADWNEMTQAMAAGTGLDPSDMTIWWLGNGGAPNKAVGTVSSKNDPQKKYKVHMEWVDGEGWKPVKVK
ncbi:DUF1510 family protein [Peribacillus glennii]|uniref:DUF1510 family protein n=1 Tax=Peribacillus glennii TaxID=2303991 RepID=A0A372LHN5_9BACI|nr:DUF1510 family protein [Peribacillus glennii]RFU65798.1 DUF1510 family protein [Peribacillus glennii]